MSGETGGGSTPAPVHEFAGYLELSLFNSSYEYARGFSAATCRCGWRSPAARSEVALMVMYLEHRANSTTPMPHETHAMAVKLLESGK